MQEQNISTYIITFCKKKSKIEQYSFFIYQPLIKLLTASLNHLKNLLFVVSSINLDYFIFIDYYLFLCIKLFTVHMA